MTRDEMPAILRALSAARGLREYVIASPIYREVIPRALPSAQQVSTTSLWPTA